MTARPLHDGKMWRPSAIVSHTLAELDGKRLVEASSEDPFEVAAVGRLACREERDEWAQFGAQVTDCTDSTIVDAQLIRTGVLDATLHAAIQESSPIRQSRFRNDLSPYTGQLNGSSGGEPAAVRRGVVSG